MIYTAAIGTRDKPRSDIHCFTESRWFHNPRMGAKVYKVLPHLWFTGATIWVDANITPRLSEGEMYNRWLGDADIALFRHPWRRKAAEEIEPVRLAKFPEETKLDEFKAHYGALLNDLDLFHCAVLLRRDTPAVRRFNEVWWSLICRWSQRDQLTFSIAASQVGIRIAVIGPPNLHEHPDFRFVNHDKQA